jgi:hypothetical protein
VLKKRHASENFCTPRELIDEKKCTGAGTTPALARHLGSRLFPLPH